MHAEGGSLRGAAWSHGGGFFHRSTDNIVLRSFRAGADRGLLLAICAGNYKDEACCFASAAAACAFVEAFEGALISEADVVPALRSAMLGAHEGIVDLSGEPIGDLRLGTTVGGRTSLKGLGAMVTAVAAVAGRLWVVHIGDCRAYLIVKGVLESSRSSTLSPMRPSTASGSRLIRNRQSSGPTISSFGCWACRKILPNSMSHGWI